MRGNSTQEDNSTVMACCTTPEARFVTPAVGKVTPFMDSAFFITKILSIAKPQ